MNVGVLLLKYSMVLELTPTTRYSHCYVLLGLSTREIDSPICASSSDTDLDICYSDEKIAVYEMQ